jgi:hypothetical protein
MSLGTLFASIRERRRRSAQQPYEKGAQIRRRLQDLLAVPAPTHEVESIRYFMKMQTLAKSND